MRINLENLILLRVVGGNGRECDGRRCLIGAPWYPHDSTPAFGGMLVALRREA